MKTSDELKQERQSLVNAQNTVVELAKTEKREFKPEEETAFDTRDAEIKALDAKIKRAEAAEDAAKRAAAATESAAAGAAASQGEERETQKVYGRVSLLKLIRQASPGSEGLDGAEKELNEIGQRQNEEANIKQNRNVKSHLSIPVSFLTRADQQTVTLDSGNYGGALVSTKPPRLVDPLRPKLWIEELGATFWTGLTGGDIPLVVSNDYTMAFMTETAAITPEKKTFAGPTLSPKRAGGAVDISNQLLLQSSIDVENSIMQGLRNGWSQLLHSAVINGGGSPEPTGILSTSNVNASIITSATQLDYADIVELQALIEEDDATERSLGYLLHPKIKAYLKTKTKDAGSGRFILEGDSLDGYKYVSTSLVPTQTDSSVSVYPIIYGDWAQCYIGQWGAVNVTLNPYSADLSNSLRLVLNTYADMQIANPKAFAKNAFASVLPAGS